MARNNGEGPAPHPTPGGIFPFTATNPQCQIYSTAGTYDLKVKVSDDDGGANELVVTIII